MLLQRRGGRAGSSYSLMDNTKSEKMPTTCQRRMSQNTTVSLVSGGGLGLGGAVLGCRSGEREVKPGRGQGLWLGRERPRFQQGLSPSVPESPRIKCLGYSQPTPWTLGGSRFRAREESRAPGPWSQGDLGYRGAWGCLGTPRPEEAKVDGLSQSDSSPLRAACWSHHLLQSWAPQADGVSGPRPETRQGRTVLGDFAPKHSQCGVVCRAGLRARGSAACPEPPLGDLNSCLPCQSHLF